MSKERYKISIIMPVYNAEKYLEQCLCSIVEQTMLQEIELIAVNDGSKDKSLEILKEFAAKYDNIKVISQENQGAIKARINGYKVACGEYIGFIDNDDFIKKDMYEKLYNKAIDKNADIAICNYQFYPKKQQNKKKWFKEFKGKVDYEFVSRNNLLWNKIVKHEYLEKIKIADLFLQIGESAYTLALIQTDNIVTLNEELYYYRVGQQSLSSDFKNIAWHENGVNNAIRKFELIKNTTMEEKWSDFFQYSIFYSMFKMLLVAAYNSNKELYDKYKREIQKYKDNPYCKIRLKKDHGTFKAFFVYHFIVKSYSFTKLLIKIL